MVAKQILRKFHTIAFMDVFLLHSLIKKNFYKLHKTGHSKSDFHTIVLFLEDNEKKVQYDYYFFYSGGLSIPLRPNLSQFLGEPSLVVT